jgi:hypothetical protein
MEPHLVEVPKRRRPNVEPLEDRLSPGGIAISDSFGILAVTPPGGGVGHSADHMHPSVGVGGLNTAEARSRVVSWTPS